MHTDRCDNTRRLNVCAKGSGKNFMYRDTTNVEPEMYDCTSNNWSHWNSNEKLKGKFGNCTRKTFDIFTTKYSYTWNVTHNTESTAVWSLKRERWESPLVQEKYCFCFWYCFRILSMCAGNGEKQHKLLWGAVCVWSRNGIALHKHSPPVRQVAFPS